MTKWELKWGQSPKCMISSSLNQMLTKSWSKNLEQDISYYRCEMERLPQNETFLLANCYTWKPVWTKLWNGSTIYCFPLFKLTLYSNTSYTVHTIIQLLNPRWFVITKFNTIISGFYFIGMFLFKWTHRELTLAEIFNEHVWFFNVLIMLF